MSKKNFDERQNIERGKAFKWAFITAIASLFVFMIIEDALELCKFDTYSIFLITFWLSFAVCMTYLISKDAFDGINQTKNPNGTLMIIYFIISIAMISMSVFDFISTDTTNFFIENGIISHNISYIICASAMLEVAVAGVIKYFTDKKLEKENKE